MVPAGIRVQLSCRLAAPDKKRPLGQPKRYPFYTHALEPGSKGLFSWIMVAVGHGNSLQSCWSILAALLFSAVMKRWDIRMHDDHSHRTATAPALTYVCAASYFLLRPQLLTRIYAPPSAGHFRRSASRATDGVQS